jgi:hypothetical protein
VVLYPSGDPSFSRGRFGNPGTAVHLMPYVKRQVLTVLHELGHNLWGLGEEYSRPTTSHVIDTSAPAPNARTIPIQPSGLSTDQLVDEDADALLTINASWSAERSWPTPPPRSQSTPTSAPCPPTPTPLP